MHRTAFRRQQDVIARNHRFFFQGGSYRHRSGAGSACGQVFRCICTTGYSNSTALARCRNISAFVLLYIRLGGYITRQLNGAGLRRRNHIACGGRYRSIHMQ